MSFYRVMTCENVTLEGDGGNTANPDDVAVKGRAEGGGVMAKAN